MLPISQRLVHRNMESDNSVFRLGEGLPDRPLKNCNRLNCKHNRMFLWHPPPHPIPPPPPPLPPLLFLLLLLLLLINIIIAVISFSDERSQS